jgi:hypothetical protein
MVAVDLDPSCPPRETSTALSRWSRRVLVLLGLGAALWLAGTATASADDGPAAPLGHALAGTAESSLVDESGPVAALQQVVVPPVAQPVQRTAAPVVAVLDRTPLPVVTKDVDAAVDLVNGAAGSVVLELSRTATQVLSAAPELPVAVPDVLRGLQATPSTGGASAPVAVAAAPPAATAFPAEPTSAATDAPADHLVASTGTAESPEGAPQLPRPAAPAPTWPPAGDGTRSSSGGHDMGAADLLVAVPGARGTVARADTRSADDALRSVALDPSFSPD